MKKTKWANFKESCAILTHCLILYSFIIVAHPLFWMVALLGIGIFLVALS